VFIGSAEWQDARNTPSLYAETIQTDKGYKVEYINAKM
jgi:hypothetical protein